jgi:hypothetical protein
MRFEWPRSIVRQNAQPRRSLKFLFQISRNLGQAREAVFAGLLRDRRCAKNRRPNPSRGKGRRPLLAEYRLRYAGSDAVEATPSWLREADPTGGHRRRASIARHSTNSHGNLRRLVSRRRSWARIRGARERRLSRRREPSFCAFRSPESLSPSASTSYSVVRSGGRYPFAPGQS